ncbi:MAG TPA: 50S ribosomal protein L13 [Longilinea sp.]|nr:50S ribosomal protein L13 [Longilinea sp.]
MDKTFVLKGKPESNWILMDANEQGIGRLATEIAKFLLGKHKPTYTPGVDMGDFVVVINARHMKISQKRLDTKTYYRISGYPGGIHATGLRNQMNAHPDRVIVAAVWGMLPHNKVGRRLIKRLRIYPESEHPHAAQKPQVAA